MTGHEQATVLATGERTSAPLAAFANAAASHVLEMDDLDPGSIYHPAAPTVSAALAVAEHIDADGDALLDAGIPPAILAFLLGNLAEGCSPDLIDAERAHLLTNLYATAYLKRNLEGDPRYSRYLTPATARKLGDVVWFRTPGCSAGAGVAAFVPIVLVIGLRRGALVRG